MLEYLLWNIYLLLHLSLVIIHILFTYDFTHLPEISRICFLPIFERICLCVHTHVSVCMHERKRERDWLGVCIFDNSERGGKLIKNTWIMIKSKISPRKNSFRDDKHHLRYYFQTKLQLMAQPFHKNRYSISHIVSGLKINIKIQNSWNPFKLGQGEKQLKNNNTPIM